MGEVDKICIYVDGKLMQARGYILIRFTVLIKDTNSCGIAKVV